MEGNGDFVEIGDSLINVNLARRIDYQKMEDTTSARGWSPMAVTKMIPLPIGVGEGFPQRNIPTDPEFRGFFRAPEGRLLVDVDYGQL